MMNSKTAWYGRCVVAVVGFVGAVFAFSNGFVVPGCMCALGLLLSLAGLVATLKEVARD